MMVNIDEVDDHYECVAYVNPNTSSIPGSVAFLTTQDRSEDQKVDASVNAVDPRTGNQCRWEDIQHLYDDSVSHSNTSQVHLYLDNGKLHLDANTEYGRFTSILEKPTQSDGSRIAGEKLSWQDFKNFVSTLSTSKFLFRGQERPWRLCTSFHRRGRYRVSDFINRDVRQLHRRLSGITDHFFDLGTPEQNGAFFNLLQHHGYPTPLLDWSYSPYVAAFFAFRDQPTNYTGSEEVRIYVFDNKEWQARYPQIQNIDPPSPHLSVMEFVSIGNPRQIPQQAVTTVTNIHDIEAYILAREKDTGVRFLKAFDIPARERTAAMRDLRFMGITPGSMFPGIDGVCEELRELNFEF